MVSEFGVRKISESRAADFSWRRLSTFQDVERCTKKLMDERSIPSKQRDNVRKQMQQLAFSIGQAREFFKSVEVAGASTRALMAYYGLMSLANAEVLWRGNGKDSFDARPSRYHAHGFELVKAEDLWEFAASPSYDQDELRGMFGLWRKYAKHLPQYGKATQYHVSGGSNWSLRQLSGETPLLDIPFPRKPISLLECIKHIPAMRTAQGVLGVESPFCRGTAEINIRDLDDERSQEVVRTYVIHHASPSLMEDVGSKFQFPACLFESLDVAPIGNGVVLTLKSYSGDRYDDVPSIKMPETFYENSEEMLYVGSAEYLNEFGYYYVALYIAGMITRYYPHIWIKELNRNSHVSALIDELVEHSMTRVPLLVASVLDRQLLLYD